MVASVLTEITTLSIWVLSLKYFSSTSDGILWVLTLDGTPPWPDEICQLSLPVSLEIVKHQLTLPGQNTLLQPSQTGKSSRLNFQKATFYQISVLSISISHIGRDKVKCLEHNTTSKPCPAFYRCWSGAYLLSSEWQSLFPGLPR